MIFNEDDIPIVHENDLKDVSKFEQLYLIGKILGETMPIKTIISKCEIGWQGVWEVNIADTGNGFSLVKFTTGSDCNRVSEGQS